MLNPNIKSLGLIAVIAISPLVLTGCGKSVSQIVGEKVAEKVIENSSGGKANVDVNSGNVKVETDQGKFETGDNVKLPSDFPKDIYVVEGSVKAAITDQSSGSFTVSIETDKSVSDVATLYQDKLKADSWKITGTMNFGETSSVVAEKDDRTVSVMASKSGSDSKTAVVISSGKK